MGLQRKHLEGDHGQDARREVHQESCGERQEQDQERGVGGHTESQSQEVKRLSFTCLSGFATKGRKDIRGIGRDGAPKGDGGV